jgi:hypothetical protein
MASIVTLWFLSKVSMIGMNTNDIFLLILMLLGVVAIAFARRVPVVPCVGFVLAFKSVVK